MAERVLELSHVGFSFQRGKQSHPILHDISFSLGQEESLSIMGSSGVGKTTLCRLMAGLISPTAGSVLFEGQPFVRPCSSITISFQNYPCFPWLSVEGNLLFGRQEGHASNSAADTEYAFWLLDQVGLTSVRKAYPRELSGGMLQRLSFARALAVRPKVLILDEPFSALDARTKADLRNLILHLQERTQFSLIVVLHDLEDAHFLTDRAIVLDGRPAQVGLDVNLKDLGFPEFREKVLAAMTMSQTRGVSLDLGKVLSQVPGR